MSRTWTRKRAILLAASSVLGLAAAALCAAPASAQAISGSLSGANSNSSSNSNANVRSSNTNVNSNRSNSISNSASLSNANSAAKSNQSQGQGQSQSVRGSGNSKQLQGQGQAQGNNNGSNTTTLNSYVPSTETIKNVPNIYAPGLAASGSQVCLGSVSAGGAAAGFGLSIGGTLVDRECQLRLNAKTLAILGYVKAAREEMCLDQEVRQAMLAAGTPCEADRAAEALRMRASYRGFGRQPATNYLAETRAVPPAPPGCHKEYQAIGGWYDVCNKGAQRAAQTRALRAPPAPPAPAPHVAVASNLTAAPPASTPGPAVRPGCRKEYQLIGGWYEVCGNGGRQ